MSEIKETAYGHSGLEDLWPTGACGEPPDPHQSPETQSPEHIGRSDNLSATLGNNYLNINTCFKNNLFDYIFPCVPLSGYWKVTCTSHKIHTATHE